METKVVNGDFVKDKIFSEVKSEIAALKKKFNKAPGIIFIGFLGAPLLKYVIPLYVQSAKAAGFNVFIELKRENTTEAEMFDLIESLNNDANVQAIVLLQPLPAHLNPIRIINKIDWNKEVEGFHPQNMLGTLIPDIQATKCSMCLSTALIELFKAAEVQLKKDQQWVFVLDDEFISNLLILMVAKTAASEVVPHDCSWSIINKTSGNLIDYCRRADVLVVVTKNPEYIQAEWLKSGVCIVDVYSNPIDEISSKKDPHKLVPIIRGGVNVESVKNIADVIVPVPGGLVAVVLPLLLRNALTSFKHSLNI